MLKTVKDVLMELDEDDLSYHFFVNYCRDYLSVFDEENENMTIKEFKEKVYDYARRLIHRLKSLEPERPEDPGVFFIYEFKNHKDSLYPSFTTIRELAKNGVKTERFGYGIDDQERILAHYILETKMTKKYIYELMADILYEVSFFGIEQEKLPEFYDRVEEAVRDAEEFAEKYKADETGETILHYMPEAGSAAEAEEDSQYEIIRQAECRLQEMEMAKVISLLREEGINV